MDGVLKQTPEEMRAHVQQGLSQVTDLRQHANAYGTYGEIMATQTMQGAAGAAAHEAFAQTTQRMHNIANTTEEKLNAVNHAVSSQEEAASTGASKIWAVVQA
jgi:hypothetical protein